MSEVNRDLWRGLAEGVLLPEYDVLVPWGISESGFRRLLPASAVTISEIGLWPQVNFTLFGFRALFGFNFVSDSNGLLAEVQFRNTHPRKLKRSFRRCVSLLTPRLGRPNVVDLSWGQQYWRYSGLAVENVLSRSLRGHGQKPVSYHMLSVRAPDVEHSS